MLLPGPGRFGRRRASAGPRSRSAGRYANGPNHSDSPIYPDDPMLPAILQATESEELILPSGRQVAVPKATPTFSLWTGVPPNDSYGRKAILEYNGRPAFAELIILWTLEEAGWDGMWIDSYRRKTRREYWHASPVPPLPEVLRSRLGLIRNRIGPWRGSWDVLAWKDNRFLFAESKRRSRDRLRQTQLAFLEAALDHEPLDSFLLVEWALQVP